MGGLHQNGNEGKDNYLDVGSQRGQSTYDHNIIAEGLLVCAVSV